MAANVWAELIKQGFENLRGGLNNLSQGTASIAQGANNGIQGFNPQNSGAGFLNTNNANAPQVSGIADMVNNMKAKNEPFAAPYNPNLQNSLGREIQAQTRPSFTPNTSGTSGSTTGLSRAIQQQAPSLFDRLKF